MKGVVRRVDEGGRRDIGKGRRDIDGEKRDMGGGI